jgi:DNA-binding response OmpR family regulator
MVTRNTPSVLLVMPDSEQALNIHRAFESEGLKCEWLTTEASADDLLSTKADCSAMIIQAVGHDLDFFRRASGWIDFTAPWPVSVAILPDSQKAHMAEVVGLGVDLPLLTDQADPHQLVPITTQLIDRRFAESKASAQWQLDLVAWEVTAPDGKATVSLTFKEREFLAKLAEQPGQPVPKEHFVPLFGTKPELFDPRRLEIMVRRLRNKISEQTGYDLPLRTAYGLGYALATPIGVSGCTPPPPQGA